MLVVGIMLIVLNAKGLAGTVYVAQPQVIEKEVQPEWATDEDALKAAQDVINRKKLEAQLEEVQSKIDSLVEERDSINTELKQY